MIRPLVAGLIMVCAGHASADGGSLVGVAKVRGPDTLVVRGARVKLSGVFPPAGSAVCADGVACVDAASTALAELLSSGPVTCAKEHRLGHGYFLGRCRNAEGTDPAAALLARGLLQPDAAAPRGYAEAAAAAKAAGAGIWGR